MTKRSYFSFFILSLFLTTVISAQSIIPVLEDSYVRGGSNANTNYGSNTLLEIKTAGNVVEYSRNTYLKFDLSNWEPAWVNNAVLLLYGTEGSNFNISASLTGDEWSEQGITWNNAPVSKQVIDSFPMTGGNKSYSVNITSAFLHEAFGDQLLSLKLFDPNGTDKLGKFQSSESNENVPRIMVFTGGAMEITSPEIASVSYLDEAVAVLWDDHSENETGFIIERKTDEQDYYVIDTVIFNTTQYRDETATIGYKYTYRIKAINPFASSVYTDEYIVDLSAETLPPIVEDFQADVLSSSTIQLRWNYPEQVSGYLLSRAGHGEFSLLDTLDYTITEYIDSRLNPESEYRYFIQAFNYLGSSEPSDTIRIITDPSEIFYFDAELGNDDNPVNSITTPWKTLDKINSMVFEPGDSVLLRSGNTWTGQLDLSGSGNEDYPVVLTSYGSGEKPLLDGNGAVGAVIQLKNLSHWTISGLEITNPATTQESRLGVLITATGGTHGGFHLDDLYIHDVFGRYSFEMIGKNTGGIGIIGENDTRFDDILIENCTIEDIVRVGIFTNGNKGVRGDRPITNLVIQNNTLKRCAGDGMIIRYAYRPLIQYNLAIENHHVDESLVEFGVAIWVRSTDEAIIQYNRVFDTKGSKDGQAFDADLEAYRTLVQYNYSANNEGGFMLVYGSSSDAIVRYNISQNDGLKGKHLLDFPIWTNPRGSGIIHNNVFYICEGIDAVLVDEALETAKLYNNLVINKGGGRLFVPSNGKTATFSNNYLEGYSASELLLNKNPVPLPSLLSNPGSGEMSFSSLEGYKLQENSPCIGSGLPREQMEGSYWFDGPVLDFWGNEVDPSKMDVGAHQYSKNTGTGQIDVSPVLEWYISPMPCRDSAIIDLRTDYTADISLQLFDLRGNKLGIVFSGKLDQGIHRFNLANELNNFWTLPSGVYFIRISSNELDVFESKYIIKS